MQKIEWNLFAQLFGKTLTSSTIRFLARNSDKHYQSDVGDAVGVANDQAIVKFRFHLIWTRLWKKKRKITYMDVLPSERDIMLVSQVTNSHQWSIPWARSACVLGACAWAGHPGTSRASRSAPRRRQWSPSTPLTSARRSVPRSYREVCVTAIAHISNSSKPFAEWWSLNPNCHNVIDRILISNVFMSTMDIYLA